MYVYVYMYIHIYHNSSNIPQCINTCWHIHIYAYMFICTFISICIIIHMYMYSFEHGATAHNLGKKNVWTHFGCMDLFRAFAQPPMVGGVVVRVQWVMLRSKAAAVTQLLCEGSCWCHASAHAKDSVHSSCSIIITRISTLLALLRAFTLLRVCLRFGNFCAKISRKQTAL